MFLMLTVCMHEMLCIPLKCHFALVFAMGLSKPTHFWGVPLIVLNFKYDLVLIRKRQS